MIIHLLYKKKYYPIRTQTYPVFSSLNKRHWNPYWHYLCLAASLLFPNRPLLHTIVSVNTYLLLVPPHNVTTKKQRITFQLVRQENHSFAGGEMREEMIDKLQLVFCFPLFNMLLLQNKIYKKLIQWLANLTSLQKSIAQKSHLLLCVFFCHKCYLYWKDTSGYFIGSIFLRQSTLPHAKFLEFFTWENW